MSLIPLDEALQRLLGHAQPLLPSEMVPLLQADQRVLAQDVTSALSVPAWDNSAMDGYAVRCEDVPQSGTVLPVAQTIAAGHNAVPLRSGTAARIFTGAPIPGGADAVVIQEDCEALTANNGALSVRIGMAPRSGQNIRHLGDDIRQDSTVLRKGMRLSPAALGLAASVGNAQLSVAQKPKVALFSCGDELVMPGSLAPQQLPAAAIYNSNRFFLYALLQRLSCSVAAYDNIPDDLAATQQALQQAARDNDVVLCSGGVSMGEKDFIRTAVESLGSLELWKLAIKPGKPFAYGTLRREGSTQPGFAHFIGLPGNPVSSFVTFLLLARPFLLALQGATQWAPMVTQLPAHFTWDRPGKRREFLRARRNAQGAIELFANQSSGALTSVAQCDGLVDNAPDQRIAPGDWVRFIPFSELLP